MNIKPSVPARGDYIHGSFIRPPTVNGHIVATDPGDLDHALGTYSYSPDNVQTAIEYARRASRDWRETPIEIRLERLESVADQLLQVTNQLAEIVTCEVGKPIWESRMEVLAAVRQCDILLKEGAALLESREIGTIHGSFKRRPLGVIAAIAPATVPVYVSIGYIISALLAGNTVVLNPSSRTPATGQMLADVIDRATLPRGVFNMIQGPGQTTGAALASHEGVDAVVVAGHLRTARSIISSAQTQIRKRIISQTGGKGTAVVLADADLNRAAYEVVTGAFLTGGQRFNSTARAVIEDTVYEPMRDLIVSLTKGLRIGHGLDSNVFMGPMLSDDQRVDILRRVTAMEQAGAEVTLRGRAPELSKRGHYLTPTVVEHGERASNGNAPEEIPGPVLALERASGRDEIWTAADRMTYGLSASVFTSSEPNFIDATQRLHVGTLNWNRATVAVSGRLPIASWGHAGKGSEGNIYLVRALSHPTSILAGDQEFDPEVVMPGVVWPRS